MLEENVYIKNIFDAMVKLQRKRKVQLEDGIIDLCEKDFHMGRKIVTRILKL